MTLVMSGNLRLDKGTCTTGTSTATPDVGCVAPIAQGTQKTKSMLNFKSPVFINGDVVLPTVVSKQYAPVLFSDRLYLGSGILKSGGTAASQYFRPENLQDSNSRLFTQMLNAAGFMKGISVDAASDTGLDVLKTGSVPTADKATMSTCIARNAAHENLTATAGASLLATTVAIDPTLGSTYTTSSMTSRLRLNLRRPCRVLQQVCS